MAPRSTCVVWTISATVEVATREASANVVMRVFMEVSFANNVRPFVVTFRRIGGWPAGTTKLAFRKLNSILCDQVGGRLPSSACSFHDSSFQVVRLRRRNRISFGDSGRRPL